MFLPVFEPPQQDSNDDSSAAISFICPRLLLPASSSSSSFPSGQKQQQQQHQHTFPVLAEHSALQHDIATDGSLVLMPDEAGDGGQATSLLIFNSKHEEEEDEGEEENGAAAAAAAATSVFASPPCVVLVYDLVSSATLLGLSNALVVIVGARDFVSVENCANCEIHVVAGKVRVVGCVKCEVYCAATVAAPAVFDCIQTVLTDFALPLPNLTFMAQLARQQEDGDLILEPAAVTETDGEGRQVAETPIQHSHRRPVTFTAEAEFDNCDRATAFVACEEVQRARRFDVLRVVHALQTAMADVELTSMLPPAVAQTMQQQLSAAFRPSEQAKAALGKHRPLFSIHDLANAAIEREPMMLSLLGGGSKQQHQQQDQSKNKPPLVLPDVNITNIDCGHIQLGGPVHNLEVRDCRGGPLTIVVPAAVRVSVVNCSNVTLMVAVSRRFAIVASQFCEVSLLCGAGAARPFVGEDCRGVELSPYNVSASSLEKMFGLCGIDPTVNTYDDPIVVEASGLMDLLLRSRRRGTAQDDDDQEEEDLEKQLVHRSQHLLELSAASASSSSPLCPLFHIAPPLLGVSLTSVGGNRAPFLAEISDPVDEAATRNVTMQCRLVRQLLELAPELLKVQEEEAALSAARKRTAQGSSSSSSSSSIKQQAQPATASGDDEEDEVDDGVPKPGSQEPFLDEGAENDENEHASRLFEMLREERRKKRNVEEGDEEQEGVEVGKDVFERQQQLDGDHRPGSALGRSRPKQQQSGARPASSSSRQQQQQQQQQHADGRDGGDVKKMYAAALDHIFDEALESAISDLVLMKQQKERQQHMKDRSPKKMPQQQQQQQQPALLPQDGPHQQDQQVAKSVATALDRIFDSDIVAAGIRDLLEQRQQKQKQEEEREKEKEQNEATATSNSNKSSPVKNRNFKRAPMAEKISSTPFSPAAAAAEPEAVPVRVPGTITRPAPLESDEEEEEEQQQQKTSPSGADASDGAQHEEEEEQEQDVPAATQATAVVGSLVSKLIDSSSSSSGSDLEDASPEKLPAAKDSKTSTPDTDSPLLPSGFAFPMPQEKTSAAVATSAAPPNTDSIDDEVQIGERDENKNSNNDNYDDEGFEDENEFPVHSGREGTAAPAGVPKLKLNFLDPVGEQQQQLATSSAADGSLNIPPVPPLSNSLDREGSDILPVGYSPNSNSNNSRYSFRLDSAPVVTLLSSNDTALARKFLNILRNASPPAAQQPAAPRRESILATLGGGVEDEGTVMEQQMLQQQKREVAERLKRANLPDPSIVTDMVLRGCCNETLQNTFRSGIAAAFHPASSAATEQQKEQHDLSGPFATAAGASRSYASADKNDPGSLLSSDPFERNVAQPPRGNEDIDDGQHQQHQQQLPGMMMMMGGQSSAHQERTRDMTLHCICFDKKVDDSLAALRNKVIRGAGKLLKQADRTQAAMVKLHDAVRDKREISVASAVGDTAGSGSGIAGKLGGTTSSSSEALAAIRAMGAPAL